MVLRYVVIMLAMCALAKAEIDNCKEKQDIAFILDSSSSMVEQGLVMAESLTLDILKNFTIRENNTRIALMTLGKEASVLFHFDTYYSKEEIYLAVSSHDGFNVSARVDKAFKAIEMLFSSSFGSREGVSRFVVFITNGLFKIAGRFNSLPRMLARTKEMEVKVLVAGVGIKMDKHQIENIVEDKVLDIVTAEEFNAPFLIRRIHEVTAQFCDMKEKMKTNLNSTVTPTSSVAP